MKYKRSIKTFSIESIGREKVNHQFESLSKKIIGAAIKVHKELGPGFMESIYEEALKIEFSANGMNHESQKEIKIYYHNQEVGTHRLDLLVEDAVVVELKAVQELADIHYAQVRSYLKATGLKVGLLLNFAKPTLEIKRIVN